MRDDLLSVQLDQDGKAVQPLEEQPDALGARNSYRWFGQSTALDG